MGGGGAGCKEGRASSKYAPAACLCSLSLDYPS